MNPTTNTHQTTPAHSGPHSNPLRTGPLAIVGGCGHVGLPLGLAFARKGYQVDLLDTSPERVAMVNGGKMPFQENDADALLTEAECTGLIKATSDTTILEDAASVIVTIGTPVDEYLDPSVGEFDRSMNQLLDQVRPGQLLILRSTVFPGMTDRLARCTSSSAAATMSTWRTALNALYRANRYSSWKVLPQLVAGMYRRAPTYAPPTCSA